MAIILLITLFFGAMTMYVVAQGNENEEFDFINEVQREQVQQYIINEAQDYIMGWISQFMPSLGRQSMDDILNQISQNWFNANDEFFYGMRLTEGARLIIEARPDLNQMDVETLLVNYGNVSLEYEYRIPTDSDVSTITSGGLQLNEEDLYNALNQAQQLNPYIISFEEVLLEDGTFVYELVHADEYVPFYFEGFLDNIMAWANSHGIEFDYDKWIDFYSAMALMQTHHDYCNHDECNHHEIVFVTYSYVNTVRYIYLYDDVVLYFSIIIATPMQSTSPMCQLRGCGWNGWTSWSVASPQQCGRSCLHCGFLVLQSHNSFNYSAANSNQCRRSCGVCGHSTNVAHSWSSWTPLGSSMCGRGCNRNGCGYTVVQSHDLVLIGYSAQHAEFRCSRCFQIVRF